MPSSLVGSLGRYRFALLFCSLLFFAASAPLVEWLCERAQSETPRVVEIATFTVMLLAAVHSVKRGEGWRRGAVLLGLLAMGLVLARLFASSLVLDMAHYGAVVVFLCYVMTVLLRLVFSSRRVTLETLFAALCVYLLLSMVWAALFSVVNTLQPGAFAFTGAGSALEPSFRLGSGRSTGALYFSLATITTLGYGDIIPVLPAARMLAVLEALVGQFYMAILVARLVGLHLAESLSSE